MHLDFIFSHWIFVWYILYCFRIVDINPKFAIICGIVVNIIMILLLLFFHTNVKLIFLFVLLCILSKGIPLFTIWNKKIHPRDISALFILFLIYFVWIFMNKKKVYVFIQKIKRLVFYKKKSISLHYIDNVLELEGVLS
jgi:signal transduction histidine kinase